jgi:chromate transporter
MKSAPEHRRSDLAEVVRLFFRLGLIAFGGPAAHIAMMEKEVVNKRKWMTPNIFSIWLVPLI